MGNSPPCEWWFLTDYRVGVGYDIHRLAAGRRLVLGGVVVPFDRRLEGHSDGDVLLHALIDALFGAAGLPDIGERFPDTDPAYRDVDSKKLALEAIRLVGEAGFTPHNLDCIVHAQKPKLTEYKQEIAESIAGMVGLPVDRVSVKAKTGEGMDAIGRGEAIAATVVAMVVGQSSGTGEQVSR